MMPLASWPRGPSRVQPRTGLRIESRRIAGADTENPARERLLPDDLVHVPIEDELDAFLASAELQRPGKCGAVRTSARARDLGSVIHWPWRKVARPRVRDSRILLRNGSLLDVRRAAFHEEAHSPSGPRQAAIAVRAGDAAHTHVVRHQEFPGGVAVVGIRAMEIAFVVTVGGLGRSVHHRPVGVVPEEEVRILGQFLDGVLPRSGDEPFLVPLACDVPQLKGISPAKRDLRTAVQHLAAGIEVLIDHDHGRSEVPRSNRGGQTGAPCSDHDDIGLVVPLNGTGRGTLR